jgi:hypothetical protein
MQGANRCRADSVQTLAADLLWTNLAAKADRVRMTMRRLLLAACVVGLSSSPLLAHAEWKPLRAKRGVEVAFKVDGEGVYIQLDSEQGPAIATVCNTSGSRGEFGISTVAPGEPPPPVLVRSLEPGTCARVAGAWAVSTLRSLPWSGTVRFD